MYSTSKKVIVVVVTFVIIFCSFNTILASNVDKVPNIEDTLNLWEKGLNSKDISMYLSVFDKDMKNTCEVNINLSKEEQKNEIQFYSVKKVKLQKIKKIDFKDLAGIFDFSKFQSTKSQLIYFYYDAEINDGMENKFTKTGKNFAVCVLTLEEGSWKISQFSAAPVDVLVTKNINLGTDEEYKIKTDVAERIQKNNLLKSEGKSLDTTTNVVIAATLGVEPTYVRVKCESALVYNNQTNYQYWGVPKNTRAYVPFQEYIKDVLPNEWDSDHIVPDSTYISDNTVTLYQALYSGALMVKSFSWYRTIVPWDAVNGFDVNDDYTQCYLHGTKWKYSADLNGVLFSWGSFCQDAFSYVSPFVIWDYDNNQPLACFYNQNDQDRTYYLDQYGYDPYYGPYTYVKIILDIYNTKYPNRNIGIPNYTL